MLRVVGVVVVLVAIVTADCFNTRVWSTTSSIQFGPSEEECTVWKRDMRTVWSSHAAASQVVMHDQYSDDSTHQFIERFSLPDGIFMDSASLQDPSHIDTPHPSMCQTNYDLFIYSGSGRIDHYDLVSGNRRASTHYPELDDSDRVSLACTGQRVFASVPASQAVWELMPADGLLVHVLARVPSPGPLFIRNDMLYVVSGRPAVAVFTFDLDTGAARSVMPTEAVQVRGIVVQDDGTVLSLSDERVTQRLASRSDNAVSTDTVYAPLLHELLSGKLGVRNGVVVDVRDGSAVAPSQSDLTNQGNVASLAYTPVVRNSTSVVLLDDTGELAEFDIVGECELEFKRYLPPMLANEGLRVLHVSTDGALLYFDSATGIVWSRLSLDYSPDKRLDTQVVDPVHGLIATQPVARACLLGSRQHVSECYDLQVSNRMQVTLPDEIGMLHWDSQHAGFVSFVLGGSNVALWHANLSSGVWTERCLLDTPPFDVGLDQTHWHTEQVAPDAYLVQWAPGVMLLIDENCTVVHRYDDDASVGHTTLAWVDGRSTEEAVCVPLNGSWPIPFRHWNREVEQSFGVWLNVGIALLVSGCCLFVLFLAAISCRTGWFLLLFHRNRSQNPWQQLQDTRRIGVCGMLCCNRTAENIVYSVLSCCPSWADRASNYMQKRYSPAVYSTTNLSNGAPVSDEHIDAAFDTHDSHWADVDLNGQSPADAARG